ncbi:GNAT family N-acetyltransferase [Bifidobacterium sp. BRDM6]|uniref:GNAT family N-acetyltransferase n=1 Tax=Bifidobacterium choloepi TaxID=2614131 RepID=A0A6I5MYI8_9BIFI|nr:GNAT family N-acetyltransferase [Bifidobacterium choloepi]
MTIFRTLFGAGHRLSHPAIAVPSSIDAPAGAPAIRLRPLVEADADEWSDVRRRNDAWLSPWESSDPQHGALLSFNEWIGRQREDERIGTSVVFAIEFAGRIVGQISLGAISYGSMRTGIVGYWIDREFAGRGFTPLAVAMLCDWAMFMPGGPGLHRIEIDIVPTNDRSRRVVEKVGAVYEGIRRRYMYINGEWKDHESYSLLAEDAGADGFVGRYLRNAANDSATMDISGVRTGTARAANGVIAEQTDRDTPNVTLPTLA